MLCLAPQEGLGIDDPERRAKIGEDKITLFRRHGGQRPTSGTRRRVSAMLLTEIDHVAIAVNDLEAAIDYYRGPSAPRWTTARSSSSDGVEEALLKVADSYMQLLTPTRPDSPVAKAIEKRGEGLHHVGYRVDDCAEALAVDGPPAATPIDKAPRPGSRGTTVAFVHPKGSFGTLIELVQE